jgi:TolA-binding protein
MRPSSRLGLVLMFSLALAGLIAWVVGVDRSIASPPPARGLAAEQPRGVLRPEGTAGGTAPNAGASLTPQIKELDGRIKALREEFHSQLDPLQEQVKALREKYEPQIADLEGQRKTLAEQGKSPEVQRLDAQEDAELAALVDREKAEIEKVKQRFADERKEIQQRYSDRRKELRGGKK